MGRQAGAGRRARERAVCVDASVRPRCVWGGCAALLPAKENNNGDGARRRVSYMLPCVWYVSCHTPQERRFQNKNKQCVSNRTLLSGLP